LILARSSFRPESSDDRSRDRIERTATGSDRTGRVATGSDRAATWLLEAREAIAPDLL